MKHITTFGGYAAAVLLLVAACSMAVGTSSDPAPGRDSEASSPARGGDSGADTGGIMVSIPTVSAHLLSSLNAEYRPAGDVSSQALLFATRVEFELQHDNEPTGDSWTTITGIEVLNGVQTFLEFQGDPELEYTLKAEVYNTNVSDDAPVIRGTSEPFFVPTAGHTQVQILGLPRDPFVFSNPGETTQVQIAQAPYRFGGGEWDPEVVLTAIGGEEWFDLDLNPMQLNSDDYVRFYADVVDGNADIIMFLYDWDGKPLRDLRGVGEPIFGWGFSPTQSGGSRAAFMGQFSEEAEPEEEEWFSFLVGMVTLNRDGNTEPVTVAVEFEVLERIPDEYAGMGSAEELDYQGGGVFAEEFTDFSLLANNQPEERVVFPASDAGFECEASVIHFFQLDENEWPESGSFSVSISVTFDVLEERHLRGEGEYLRSDDLIWLFPTLLLRLEPSDVEANGVYYSATGEIEGVEPVESFQVQENADGTTSITLNQNINAEEYSAAYLMISSSFPGNQFTVEWE